MEKYAIIAIFQAVQVVLILLHVLTPLIVACLNTTVVNAQASVVAQADVTIKQQSIKIKPFKKEKNYEKNRKI